MTKEKEPKESILKRWSITEDQLTEVIDNNPSLRGMVLGYVAEEKFDEQFLQREEITEIRKDDDHDRKKKGDRTFKYGGRSFTVEVKSLQTATCKQASDGTWTGKAQVDGSDRRVIKFKDGTELNTTLLLRGEFDILAVNCYAFGGEWRFAFARNSDLPTSSFSKYTKEQREQLISSMVPVSWPPQAPFTDDPISLLNKMIAAPEPIATPAVIEDARQVAEAVDMVVVKED
ncbi:TPA: hypothetical protein ACXNG6_002641 [Stenotrophomonas maltophilia]